MNDLVQHGQTKDLLHVYTLSIPQLSAAESNHYFIWISTLQRCIPTVTTVFSWRPSPTGHFNINAAVAEQ